MESANVLVLLAGMQIVGMCIMAYCFLRVMSSMSADMRTMGMFKKSRTREDLFAMKNMGLNDENWKEEEEETEPEEELYTAEDIPDAVLVKIAESDGS
jgi:hypothetical protein